MITAPMGVAQEREFLGEVNGIKSFTASAADIELLAHSRERIAKGVFPPGVSDLQVIQLDYANPPFGRAFPEGGAIIVGWFEDRNDGVSSVTVFLDGVEAGTKPASAVGGLNPLSPVSRLMELRVHAFRAGPDASYFYSLEPLVCQSAQGLGQHPGDVNQDGDTDFTDQINLIGHFFRGEPSELPCEGPTNGAANRALADWNGDRGVDLTDAIPGLTFEFLGGADHMTAPSASCLIIEGCPSRWDAG
jgi:hypothetical protein